MAVAEPFARGLAQHVSIERKLALMTAWQADSMGQRDVAVTIYTPESAPLQAFGIAAGPPCAWRPTPPSKPPSAGSSSNRAAGP